MLLASLVRLFQRVKLEEPHQPHHPYQSILIRFPPEILLIIIKELDPLDIVPLLQSTPELACLFQLVVGGSEPFFFNETPRCVPRIPLKDFDPMVHRALITLVDLKRPSFTGLQSASNSLKHTTNYIAIDLAGFPHKNEERILMQTLDTFLSSSKIVLVNGYIRIEASLIKDPTRLTIKDSYLDASFKDTDVDSMFRLHNIDDLALSFLPVKLLNSLDFSVEPRRFLSFKSYPNPPMEISNKTFGAVNYTGLESVSLVENVIIYSGELSVYPLQSESGNPPLLKNISAPRAKTIRLTLVDSCTVRLEETEFPVVEQVIVEAVLFGSPTEEFNLLILELLKLPTLKTFCLRATRSEVLFVDEGALLRNLQGLEFNVSSRLSEATRNVELPNLKSLSMSYYGSFDGAHATIPLLSAPNLTTIELHWYSPIEDSEVSSFLEMYPHIETMVLRFSPSNTIIDVSESIMSLRRNLKSITLGNTNVDVFTEPSVFPRLETLALDDLSTKEHFSLNFSAPNLRRIDCTLWDAKTVTVCGFPALRSTFLHARSELQQITIKDLTDLIVARFTSRSQKITCSNLPRLLDLGFKLLPGEQAEDILEFTNVSKDAQLHSV